MNLRRREHRRFEFVQRPPLLESLYELPRFAYHHQEQLEQQPEPTCCIDQESSLLNRVRELDSVCVHADIGLVLGSEIAM
jgi:hypothetical protein